MNLGAQQFAATAPFLWGSFTTFSLAEIFGVLALSRQLVAMRFSDEDKDVGAIAVKAGQVIGAEDFRTQTRGADALKALIYDPGTAFAVVMLPRSAPELDTAPVIGKLAALLPEVASQREAAEETPKAAPTPEAANDLDSLEEAFDSEQGQSSAPTVTSGEAPRAPGAGETDQPGPAQPDASPPPAGDVVLRGNVSDASFDEILEVLQLGDQSLVISFMRGDSRVGTLNLLSEQVLAATYGSLRGIEAFRELSADHGETFEVRRATAVDATESLGSVTELLTGAQPAPQPAPHPVPDSPPDVSQNERPVFMQGLLSDFPLDLLIGSLDLSRQPIELVLRRGETTLHRVQIKAGRITAVLSTAGQGADAALAAIRNDPGDEFVVYRCPELAGGPPVATLQALVSETGPVRIPAPAAQSPAAPAGLETAIEEIRAALATLAPRRSGRALLWVVLALQILCLIATGGLLALLLFPHLL